MSTTNLSILFLGATGGVGGSALRHSLSAGYTCVALVRTPSKLSAAFPGPHSNLRIVQGNAHSTADVAKALVHPTDPSRLVDRIIFSIGGVFSFKNFTLDDPDVCRQGASTLLAALSTAGAGAAERAAAAGCPPPGRPHIVAVSTTGISRFGRDLPLAMLPLYRALLSKPHEDKRQMEDVLARAAGAGAAGANAGAGADEGERWPVVVVRPSLLVDGAAAEKTIRIGKEDSNGIVGRREAGYTISREDVGRWIFENLIRGSYADGSGWQVVSLTW